MYTSRSPVYAHGLPPKADFECCIQGVRATVPQYTKKKSDITDPPIPQLGAPEFVYAHKPQARPELGGLSSPWVAIPKTGQAAPHFARQPPASTPRIMPIDMTHPEASTKVENVESCRQSRRPGPDAPALQEGPGTGGGILPITASRLEAFVPRQI